MQNTVTPAEVERQYFHHRSRYEIARKLAGDPEEARRIVKDIAACLANTGVACTRLARLRLKHITEATGIPLAEQRMLSVPSFDRSTATSATSCRTLE